MHFNLLAKKYYFGLEGEDSLDTLLQEHSDLKREEFLEWLGTDERERWASAKAVEDYETHAAEIEPTPQGEDYLKMRQRRQEKVRRARTLDFDDK